MGWKVGVDGRAEVSESHERFASGVLKLVLAEFPTATFENKVVYPEGVSIHWDKVPPKMRPYQELALAALLKANHGAISLATGSGKSLVILNLVKKLGLKTLVVAPSVSIAEQLYRDFVKYVGKKYVGRFFSSKKESSFRVLIFIFPFSLSRNNAMPNTIEMINIVRYIAPCPMIIK